MVYLKLNGGGEIRMLLLSLMPEHSILMRICCIILAGVHLIPADLSADTGFTLANIACNLFLAELF